jgi:hypothetical protein
MKIVDFSAICTTRPRPIGTSSDHPKGLEEPCGFVRRIRRCLRARIDIHFEPDRGGTHINAPRHFGGGIPINEYTLEKSIVPGICIDLRHIAPRAEITPSDPEEALEKSFVGVPHGGTVLLCIGHHERTFPGKEYATDNRALRSQQPNGWPTGRCTFRHRLDATGPNERCEPAGAWTVCHHIESLCNLEPPRGQRQFTFIGLPMKWRDGMAPQIRAVAIFDFLEDRSFDAAGSYISHMNSIDRNMMCMVGHND